MDIFDDLIDIVRGVGDFGISAVEAVGTCIVDTVETVVPATVDFVSNPGDYCNLDSAVEVVKGTALVGGTLLASSLFGPPGTLTIPGLLTAGGAGTVVGITSEYSVKTTGETILPSIKEDPKQMENIADIVNIAIKVFAAAAEGTNRIDRI